MRLSDFILQNIQPILRAWDDFAKTVDKPGPILDASGLRDHAEQILRTVALDMKTAQTAQEQIDKSRGSAPYCENDTAAQTHATTRLDSGFSLDQMVSEYRALRSSVLRLWLAEHQVGADHEIDDIVRFNESIDQALAESITSYGKSAETTRKIVLGALGHDLRTPLGAAMLGAQLVRQSEQLSDREKKISSLVVTSIGRASEIVSNLLDLARSNLGSGIPVRKEKTDLGAIGLALIEELRYCHKDRRIELELPSKVVGQFDPVRMGQVFSNLVANAVQHGDPHHPVTVKLQSKEGIAQLSVHNHGKPIPAISIPYIFNPLERHSAYASQDHGASGGLGLGLFIASEIVNNHGGRIEVESTAAEGTTFLALIPTS